MGDSGPTGYREVSATVSATVSAGVSVEQRFRQLWLTPPVVEL